MSVREAIGARETNGAIPRLSGDIRHLIEYNFSRQDERVMINRRYDAPEKLSATDAEVVQWRRFVVTKHFGGRDAAFPYRNPEGLSPDAVPLERVSVRYF